MSESPPIQTPTDKEPSEWAKAEHERAKALFAHGITLCCEWCDFQTTSWTELTEHDQIAHSEYEDDQP